MVILYAVVHLLQDYLSPGIDGNLYDKNIRVYLKSSSMYIRLSVEVAWTVHPTSSQSLMKHQLHVHLSLDFIDPSNTTRTGSVALSYARLYMSCMVK